MIEFRVVLVEPEHPHNIGFVARAMHCNAIPDLHIVFPRRDNVPEESYRTAHNSREILDNAVIVHNLEDAIADCDYAVAFSRRIFESVQPHTSLPKLAEKLPKEGRVALVFGRESCGLRDDEVERCALICEIPVPGLMSLNLAQAVSVGCYELCRAGLLTGTGLRKREYHTSDSTRKADVGEMENFLGFLQDHLTERYKRRSWTDASVRLILQRLQPSRGELFALYGLARSLAKSSPHEDRREAIKKQAAEKPAGKTKR